MRATGWMSHAVARHSFQRPGGGGPAATSTTYVRRGSPRESRKVSRNVLAPFTLHLRNGPLGTSRVSSAIVMMDGLLVVTVSDLSWDVATLQRVVELKPGSQISVGCAVRLAHADPSDHGLRAHRR